MFSKSLPMAGLTGVLLALALTVATPARAGHATGEGFPMWGEVIGGASSDLAVTLSGPGGRVLARQRARVSRDEGRTYYTVRWPVRRVRRALERDLPLTLGFDLDGSPSASELSLPAGGEPPGVVHLVDGHPVLPEVQFLVAQAGLQDNGSVRFRARLLNSGTDRQKGTLVWFSRRGGTQGPSAALTLEPGRTALQELTWQPEDSLGLAPHWQARWIPARAALPGTMQRARLMRTRTVVPRGDASDTPGQSRIGSSASRVPAMGKAAQQTRFDTGPLALRRGEYLELHLEYTGDEAGVVARTLSSHVLADPDRRASKLPPFSMSEAHVTPLPGGGLWVSACWVVTAGQTASSLELRAPVPTPLPGTWDLRYLGTGQLYTPARDY